MKQKDIHVVQQKEGWAVRKDGDKVCLSTANRSDAVRLGWVFSRRTGGELVVSPNVKKDNK